MHRARRQTQAVTQERPIQASRIGFLSLPKEVVVALTANGLAWGAIDFQRGEWRCDAFRLQVRRLLISVLLGICFILFDLMAVSASWT